MWNEMTDPIRHSSSQRNRRKALHHAENIKEEAMHLYSEIVLLSEKADRLIRLACKIENRLKAEVRNE
jgi:hypothetical protein